MNCKYIFFLVILSFIIIFIKKKTIISTNLYKHKNIQSKYAHFSNIDKVDFLRFPKLLFASPKKYTLYKGDALIIPAKWWHWVKTPVKTFSINFWINKKLFNKPLQFKHNFNIDFSVLNDEIVKVWNTNNDIVYRSKFSDFLSKEKLNEYVITLEDYNPLKSNKNIKEKLKKQIVIPDILKNKNVNYDYNIWITSNKSNTGLHYDDEDGILYCLEGKKDITLYPPSDAKYLYPIEIRKWDKSKALDFRYNSYNYKKKINGLSSGRFLYEITKNNDNILRIIDNFVSKNGINKTIWGFKNQNKNFRLEFYKYNLGTKDDLVIKSKDVYFEEPYIGDEDHLYYKVKGQSIMLPFWGYGTTKIKNKEYRESKIFVIDSYQSFFNNYNKYMNRLEYTSIAEKFKDIILNKYKCYEMCIFNKKENQIFVMYLGISSNDFIDFLTSNNYSKDLISHYKNNSYKINNEIAIIYDTNTMEIIRSGFYGIV